MRQVYLYNTIHTHRQSKCGKRSAIRLFCFGVNPRSQAVGFWLCAEGFLVSTIALTAGCHHATGPGEGLSRGLILVIVAI